MLRQNKIIFLIGIMAILICAAIGVNNVVTSLHSSEQTIAPTTKEEVSSTQPNLQYATTTELKIVKTSTATPKQLPLQWGAYVGDGNIDLPAFENTIGKKVKILADFEGWDTDFPVQFLDSIGRQGKTLLIFWEPSFGYNTINSGSEDDYIKQFASGAKAYGYPVILVPFDEFNINENDWGFGINGNSPANFVTAWRHIHDLFALTDATNVKFGWAPNYVSVPNYSGNAIASYYPGDAYVDYVGVDGFNDNNPQMSFDQLFGNVLKKLETYNKPIYIFSFATAQGAQKAAWITDALTVQLPKYFAIKGWIWFNTLKEHDWRIWSDPSSLSAFKNAIKIY